MLKNQLACIIIPSYGWLSGGLLLHVASKILIVDDEPDVRELFNITLKMAGFTTQTVKDGLEAVDVLKEEIPDLILLDLMMPNLDGFGLLEKIRKDKEEEPIRVLVATAKLLEEADRNRLSSWPVVGVLNKGELDIGKMVTLVNDALKASPRKSGEIVEASAPVKPTSGSVPEATKKPSTIRTSTGSRVRPQKPQ